MTKLEELKAAYKAELEKTQEDLKKGENNAT